MQRNDPRASPMLDENTEDLATDRLRGIKPIAAFLGETEPRVSYMVERGLIPHTKEGRSVVSRKSWLRAHYARPSSGAAASAGQ
jgi:hypothetical protein